MNDQVYSVLMDLLKKQKSAVYVFTNSEGKPILSQITTQVETLKKALDAANVQRVRFHDLRHTYSSHFMMNGGNIFDLQKLLGHRDLKSTMIYAHLSPDHLLKASSIVNFKADEDAVTDEKNSDSYQIATTGLQLIQWL